MLKKIILTMVVTIAVGVGASLAFQYFLQRYYNTTYDIPVEYSYDIDDSTVSMLEFIRTNPEGLLAAGLDSADLTEDNFITRTDDGSYVFICKSGDILYTVTGYIENGSYRYNVYDNDGNLLYGEP